MVASPELVMLRLPLSSICCFFAMPPPRSAVGTSVVLGTCVAVGTLVADGAPEPLLPPTPMPPLGDFFFPGAVGATVVVVGLADVDGLEVLAEGLMPMPMPLGVFFPESVGATDTVVGLADTDGRLVAPIPSMPLDLALAFGGVAVVGTYVTDGKGDADRFDGPAVELTTGVGDGVFFVMPFLRAVAATASPAAAVGVAVPC